MKGSLRGTLADRKELQLSLKAKALMRRYDVGSSVLGEATDLMEKRVGEEGLFQRETGLVR